MISKWLNDRRQRAARSDVERLTRQLSQMQPPDWRSVDQETIKWPRAGEMWDEEAHILKRLARCGPLAKSAVPAITHALDQALWGHCGKRDPGAGELALCGPTLSDHDEVHLSSAVFSLEALEKIGVDEPAVLELLKDVIEESKPMFQEHMNMLVDAHGGERSGELLRDLALSSVSQDCPYRGPIRAGALRIMGASLKRLIPEGKAELKCADGFVDALSDHALEVRISAVAALSAIRSLLPIESRRIR